MKTIQSGKFFDLVWLQHGESVSQTKMPKKQGYYFLWKKNFQCEYLGSVKPHSAYIAQRWAENEL